MVLPTQRELFDIPSNIYYFNCSYMGPQLNVSREHLIQGVKMKSSPWTWPVSQFFEEAEQVRVLCASLFGGKNDNYAVIPSASYGLGTAARAIEPLLKKGEQVLILFEDFPSNVLTWRRVCKETGAEIVTISKQDGLDWTNTILNSINEKTKVVSIPSCHWTNGEIIDLEIIGNKCNSLNIIFIVDATQSLGAMPHNVESLQVDFLISACYKWMLCPYGFSVLFVHDKWFESRPLEESWLARENAENFAGLVNYNEIYQVGARKFDMGEKGMPTILPGALTALNQIKDWGIENISNTIKEINNELSNFFINCGFQPIKNENRVPHILGINLGTNTTDYVGTLKAKNVFISQRGNSLRITPHLHINQNDIEKLKQEVRTL